MKSLIQIAGGEGNEKQVTDTEHTRAVQKNPAVSASIFRMTWLGSFPTAFVYEWMHIFWVTYISLVIDT